MVTPAPPPSGVTIHTQGSGTALATGSPVRIGTLIRLSAFPDWGYEFVGWQVISGGGALSNPAAKNQTFIMPNNPVKLLAVFTPYMGSLDIPASILTEYLPNATRFAPHRFFMQHTGGVPWAGVSWFIPENATPLPLGLELRYNGEIYGTPLVAGTFPVTIGMESGTYRFPAAPVTRDFTLTVLYNTAENIEIIADIGYELIMPLPPVITELQDYFIIKSAGPYHEFMNLWRNGRMLIRDVEYSARPGDSTVITIYAQTFRDLGPGTHTLVLEFREHGDEYGELRRVGQNFEIRLIDVEPPGNNQQQPVPPSVGQSGWLPVSAAPAGTARSATRTATGTRRRTRTGEELFFQFPHGTVTFDNAAMLSLANQGLSENVTITFDVVSYYELTPNQREVVQENQYVYLITAASGENSIT